MPLSSLTSVGVRRAPASAGGREGRGGEVQAAQKGPPLEPLSLVLTHALHPGRQVLQLRALGHRVLEL